METSIEQPIPATKHYQLTFTGKGSEYFSIMIVNWLLTIVTLGLYYPWARAKKLQYTHAQTKLEGERFHFSGTGKEMFVGFIKVIIFYLGILGLFYFISRITESPVWGVLTVYLMIFAIIPLAIHGSLRYRLSRTSYRGIRFGYRGDRSELVRNFFKWLLFTLLTFGLYGAWMAVNLRNYTHKHIRYGDAEFSYNGDGGDFFLLNLKGYFLSLITLGIYSFWWFAELFVYYVNNLKVSKEEHTIYFHSTATGFGLLKLLVGNFFLVVFTLGFGKAWADMRTERYLTENIKMAGDIDLERIHQTEEEYTNAFGEDVMDFFDIDLA
jgi:uncharacterized membrane protein YjgN (DUF898 family)